MRQAKDSASFDPPPLQSFRSVPPQVPTGVPPTGMEQQDSLSAGRIRSLGRQPGHLSLPHIWDADALQASWLLGHSQQANLQPQLCRHRMQYQVRDAA